jgi:secreted trypsin-like serine protease
LSITIQINEPLNLTAAQCVNKKRVHKKVRARDVLAYFGYHNLSDPHESDRVSVSPKTIIIHEDWNSESSRYDADIAILIFVEDIQTTKFIKPISMLKTDEPFAMTEGIVAGWGDSNHTSKHIMNIKDQLDCSSKSSKVAAVSSKRTFCAATRYGLEIDNGDSGSGLFIRQGNSFYLKGIVSAAIIDPETNKAACNDKFPCVFTNVPDFQNWIQKHLK